MDTSSMSQNINKQSPPEGAADDDTMDSIEVPAGPLLGIDCSKDYTVHFDKSGGLEVGWLMFSWELLDLIYQRARDNREASEAGKRIKE